MPAEPMGPIHAQLVLDHDDIDQLLLQLIVAYETNDRDIAAAAYADVEQRLRAHFAAEEELLFPDFATSEPEEARALMEEHRRIRARLDELGVGVDLHLTRIGAIRDLVQMLRAHAARENALFYRFADRIASEPSRHLDVERFFVHGRSPIPPVQS